MVIVRVRRSWGAAVRLVATLLLTTMLLTALVAVGASAAGEAGCSAATRLFAVAAGTGHLSELPYCAESGAFLAATEVDGADWRQYRDVFAARDGETAVVYAVSPTGELWARRQQAAGAGLDPPVRVGASVDWAQFSAVLAPQAGALHGVGEPGGSVRTFRHVDWTAGGSAVVEDEPLFARFIGPAPTAVRWGVRAEGNYQGMHFRVWKAELQPYYQDVWYVSGLLPPGVTGVVGAEPSLYGLTADGQVVLLRQPTHPPAPPKKYWDCPRYNDLDWVLAAESTGSYVRVVSPVGIGYPVPPSLPAPPNGSDCSEFVGPYEWQR